MAAASAAAREDFSVVDDEELMVMAAAAAIGPKRVASPPASPRIRAQSPSRLFVARAVPPPPPPPQPSLASSGETRQSLHTFLRQAILVSIDYLNNTSTMDVFLSNVHTRMSNVERLLSVPLLNRLERSRLLPNDNIGADDGYGEDGRDHDDDVIRQQRTPKFFLWNGQFDEIDPTDWIDMHLVPEPVQDLVQLACNVLHDVQQSGKESTGDDNTDEAIHDSEQKSFQAPLTLSETDLQALWVERPVLHTAACGFLWTFFHAYLLANLDRCTHMRAVAASAREANQAAWSDTCGVLQLWLQQLKTSMSVIPDEWRACTLDKFVAKPSLRKAHEMTPGISSFVLQVATKLRVMVYKAPTGWSIQRQLKQLQQFQPKHQRVNMPPPPMRVAQTTNKVAVLPPSRTTRTHHQTPVDDSLVHSKSSLGASRKPVQPDDEGVDSDDNDDVEEHDSENDDQGNDDAAEDDDDDQYRLTQREQLDAVRRATQVAVAQRPMRASTQDVSLDREREQLAQTTIPSANGFDPRRYVSAPRPLLASAATTSSSSSTAATVQKRRTPAVNGASATAGPKPVRMGNHFVKFKSPDD